MISCTPAGFRIGIITSTKWNSDWCAVVEDSAVWSSPIRASTPPFFEEPAKLAWRNTSPVRSTPGPLPYHMPNTPSYLPSPRSSACCVPQIAVAARSSLRPVWNRTLCWSSALLRAHELLVEPAERRAAVARDVAGGVEPGEPVALLLHQGGADQRLIAGDEHAALRKIVFVVEGDVLQRHWASARRFDAAAALPPAHNAASAQSRHRLAGIKASAMLTFRARSEGQFRSRWDASRKLHAAASRGEIWRNAAVCMRERAPWSGFIGVEARMPVSFE